MTAQVSAYLGLGSNMGDRVAYLSSGIQGLARRHGIDLLRCSSTYASRPWGGDRSQPEFLNLVVEVGTTLEPFALLDACQAVEQEAGRCRIRPWGPRTLDIDLLLYGKQEIQAERLSVPHPHLYQRGFVLLPLAELSPELILPGGSTVLACLDSLAPRSLLRDVWLWQGTSPVPASSE